MTKFEWLELPNYYVFSLRGERFFLLENFHEGLFLEDSQKKKKKKLEKFKEKIMLTHRTE